MRRYPGWSPVVDDELDVLAGTLVGVVDLEDAELVAGRDLVLDLLALARNPGNAIVPKGDPEGMRLDEVAERGLGPEWLRWGRPPLRRILAAGVPDRARPLPRAAPGALELEQAPRSDDRRAA